MDLYETLEVPKTASKAEIRRAYKRKASKAHPDKGGTKESFQMVSHAHAVLTDDKRREKYDAGGGDEQPLDRNAALMSELVGAFMHVIENASDPTRIDVVAEVKRKIDYRIAQAQDKRKQTARHLNKISRAQKRIKRKGKGENFFANALAKIASDGERNIREIDAQVEDLEAMYVLIAQYSYEVDKDLTVGGTWTFDGGQK